MVLVDFVVVIWAKEILTNTLVDIGTHLDYCESCISPILLGQRETTSEYTKKSMEIVGLDCIYQTKSYSEMGKIKPL